MSKDDIVLWDTFYFFFSGWTRFEECTDITFKHEEILLEEKYVFFVMFGEADALYKVSHIFFDGYIFTMNVSRLMTNHVIVVNTSKINA